MLACPIPMEETATTVPRSIPRQRPPITPVAVPTIPVAGVITHHRPGTTHRPRGITSQRRAITISQGCINRPRVITSPEAITGAIRTKGGTGITEAAGIMTTGGVADATTTTVDAVTTMVMAITMAGVATGRHHKTLFRESGASSAVFFSSEKARREKKMRALPDQFEIHSLCSISSDVLGTLLHFYF